MNELKYTKNVKDIDSWFELFIPFKEIPIEIWNNLTLFGKITLAWFIIPIHLILYSCIIIVAIPITILLYFFIIPIISRLSKINIKKFISKEIFFKDKSKH